MAGQGNNIVATDYNAIQEIVYYILYNVYGQRDLNTVTANGGTGQVTASPPNKSDTPTTIIRAPQWNALQTDINRIQQHIYKTQPSLTTDSTTVKVGEADRAAYLAAATALNSSTIWYGYPADTVTATRVGGYSRDLIPAKKTAVHIVNIPFASTTAATYFFNAGSKITIASSLTPQVSGLLPGDFGTLNTDWVNLLAISGTLSFTRSNTTCDTSPSYVTDTNFGFINATSTETIIFSRNIADNLYTGGTPDRYYITVKYVGSTLTFTSYFTNTYTSTGYATPGSTQASPAVNYPVTGTLYNTVTAYYATGSNVSVSGYYPAASITDTFNVV
jgi:hypothetical protein